MDWKEILLQQSQELGILPDDTTGTTESEPADTPSSGTQKEPLHIAFERKGRGGKTVTIIYGFECDDNQLKEIAAMLKSKLGTGGSARGGEILIQGDRRGEVKNLLEQTGYKVKG